MVPVDLLCFRLFVSAIFVFQSDHSPYPDSTMSRHRDFHNLNIHGLTLPLNNLNKLSKPLDELDDDALSDGGEEEMTIEQQGLPEANILASVQAEYVQAQMNDGLEQVRLTIGNQVMSELSDNSIKDALWEYYFDVEKTVQWALGL